MHGNANKLPFITAEDTYLYLRNSTAEALPTGSVDAYKQGDPDKNICCNIFMDVKN